MVDVELALLEQIATYLDDQEVATYSTSGYTGTDTAIVFGELPASPDRCIGLTVYDSDDYVNQNISEYRVQLWCRGTAGSTVDGGTLAGSIFNVLQGLQDQWWGDLYLVQARRLSLAPMGMDGNQRQERAENYAFRVNTPATVGRPD